MHVIRPKDVNTLSSVIQAPGETLRHYLERFHTACAEIRNPNDNSILMALTKGIDPDSEFGNWLAGKPPASLDRFHAKAAQFLRREDAKQSRKQTDAGSNVGGTQSNVAIKQSGESSGKVQLNIKNKQARRRESVNQLKKQDQNRGPQRKNPKFDSYTPLNISLEDLYLRTRNAIQYEKPAPRPSSERQIQTGKFCRFHEGYGHDTNECRHLQDLVEKLVREGKLEQFVRTPQPRDAGPSNPINEPNRPR